MTIQQQIDSAREHLANGNDYSYRAQMSAAIRASISSRSLNQYYKALEEDGFELLNQFNPVVEDIVQVEWCAHEGWKHDAKQLIDGCSGESFEHRVDSETDDDVSDWLNRR
jgi:hypothetical protein